MFLFGCDMFRFEADLFLCGTDMFPFANHMFLSVCVHCEPFSLKLVLAACCSFARRLYVVVQLKMAAELGVIHGSTWLLTGKQYRHRHRNTPWHLQDVMHLVYLRKRRIQGERWNRIIGGMMFMHQKPRICLMLPLPRPQRIPAELPLADAIHMDVAQFLAIPDGELVGTTVTPDEAEEIEFIQMQETLLQEVAPWAEVNSWPASPTTGTSSRMPTTSSGESWEVLDSTGSSPVARSHSTLAAFDSRVNRDLGPYLPLAHWEAMGYPSEKIIAGWTSAKTIRPHGVCYRFYIGDDEQKQELQKLQLSPSDQQMPPELQRVERTAQDRQLPSSSSTQLPPPTAKAAPKPPFNPHPVKAALKPKAPPKPPFNLHPVFFKAAPECIGPPPNFSSCTQVPLAKSPPHYPPDTRPPKMWKKKIVRQVKCEKCGFGNVVHQFM